MAGRPKIEVTDQLCEDAEKYASHGLTKKQIAHNLGFTYQTLYQMAKKNDNFSNAIKNGAAKGIAKVANALFENATNGNVTAQIFFLKNRSPNEWKDRVPEGTNSDAIAPQRVEVIVKGATLADPDTATS
jgi:hypothetical protein